MEFVRLDGERQWASEELWRKLEGEREKGEIEKGDRER